jgi:hypothetical protein
LSARQYGWTLRRRRPPDAPYPACEFSSSQLRAVYSHAAAMMDAFGYREATEAQCAGTAPSL